VRWRMQDLADIAMIASLIFKVIMEQERNSDRCKQY
jgi:hypothetical protein